MSGGHFDHFQYRINDCADEIESLIQRNGKKKPEKKIYSWEREHPEYQYYESFSDEVLEKFKEAIPIIRKAYTYIQRIDWLLSGDDGEESFLERLEKEIKQIEEK